MGVGGSLRGGEGGGREGGMGVVRRPVLFRAPKRDDFNPKIMRKKEFLKIFLECLPVLSGRGPGFLEAAGLFDALCV